jgi:exodeoxyribonuclease-1
VSFVFFDIETTGLSRHFDQILHFAAIRTDHRLVELERFDIRSRLCGHVIPHPAALLINGIGVSELLDPLLPSHYEMMCAIRAKLLSWSPSIFAGYNSIRFDEEMLRQAFFKTLHPLYLTSMHNNGRGDVLHLAMSAVASSADSLVVPIADTGRRSFRLGPLLAENGIEHKWAHDAVSDVEAMVELCRLIQRRAPQAWQSFVRFSKKSTTIDFVENEEAFVLTEYFSGEAYHSPVVCIGRDPSDANKRLCLVLDSQTRRLMAASGDEMQALLAARPSPIRSVKVNGAPSLTSLYDVDGLSFDLSEAELEGLAGEVKADGAVRQRLLASFQSLATPWPDALHVEQRIYDRFTTPEDEAVLQRFHAASWQERARLLTHLKDQRLKTLGLRLIFDESPSVLDSSQKAEVHADMPGRQQDGAGPLTLDRAVIETDKLILEHTAEDVARLLEYRQFLLSRGALNDGSRQ